MPLVPSMTPAQIERMRADREARARLGKALHRDVSPNPLPKDAKPIAPVPQRFTWAVPFEPKPYTPEWKDKQRDDFLTLIDALDAPVIITCRLDGLRAKSPNQNTSQTITPLATRGAST